MAWLNPDVFFWLLFLPFGALLYVIRHLKRERVLRDLLGRQKLFLTASLSLWIRHLKTGLCLFVLALMILALARPVGEGERETRKSAGVRMILAVDVSHSMTAEDVYPNRLAFLKKELSRLLDLSAGDQTALMAFSGSAVLISPFTADLSLVKVYLDDLSPEYLSQRGTSFKQTLWRARKIFQGVASQEEEEKPVQVLIVASDGEDHIQNWKKSVQPLRDLGVHIFTLSVGTKEGGVLPVRNREGDIMEYKKDSSGKAVVSRVYPKALKQLASKGRGAYYHLSYSGGTVERLRGDLDRLKKTVFKTGSFHKKKELFQWFLIPAWILGLTELLLSEWRRRRA